MEIENENENLETSICLETEVKDEEENEQNPLVVQNEMEENSKTEESEEEEEKEISEKGIEMGEMTPDQPMPGEIIQDTEPDETGILGYEMLENIGAIIMKRKFDFIETFLGCELDKSYKIYNIDSRKSDLRGQKMFRCQESSSLIFRNCIAGNCRPFTMSINYLSGEAFLILTRICGCTLCCLGRPVAKVMLANGKKREYIGKIVLPCNCCSLGVQIYDENDIQKYYIFGEFCQTGILCSSPCQPCQNVQFTLNESKTALKISKIEKVSIMTFLIYWFKRVTGCLQKIRAQKEIHDYLMEFPDISDGKDRALFLAALFVLDLTYFDDDQPPMEKIKKNKQ